MFTWLRKTASDVYGFLVDPVVVEDDIETLDMGRYLGCQIRQRLTDNSHYVALKVQEGGDTIWVSLDRMGVDQLKSFLDKYQPPAEI